MLEIYSGLPNLTSDFFIWKWSTRGNYSWTYRQGLEPTLPRIYLRIASIWELNVRTRSFRSHLERSRDTSSVSCWTPCGVTLNSAIAHPFNAPGGGIRRSALKIGHARKPQTDRFCRIINSCSYTRCSRRNGCKNSFSGSESFVWDGYLWSLLSD